MSTDGKSLEALVAFVEGRLLPTGLSVSTRERVVENGKIVAEFDVTVRGKVGSTNFAWLIQCRDRPSEGPQDTEWIEQLVARRSRFHFSKVTAVSTTGFGAPARTYAAREGIELREVRSLSPGAFADWLGLQFMEFVERRTNLKHIDLLLDPAEQEERVQGLRRVLQSQDPKRPTAFLKATKTGASVTPHEAFRGLVQQNAALFAEIEPNGSPKPVSILAHYTNDQDHFVVETDKGEVRIRQIAFEGEVSVAQSAVPFTTKAEYVQTAGGGQISQYAAFAPINVNGTAMAIEFHRVEPTGDVHVVARSVGGKSK